MITFYYNEQILTNFNGFKNVVKFDNIYCGLILSYSPENPISYVSYYDNNKDEFDLAEYNQNMIFTNFNELSYFLGYVMTLQLTTDYNIFALWKKTIVKTQLQPVQPIAKTNIHFMGNTIV